MDMRYLPAAGPQRADERAAWLRQLTGPLARHLADQLSIRPHPPVDQIVSTGLTRLRRTITHYRRGTTIDDATAARLAMDLHVIRIRDEAWLPVSAAPAPMTRMLMDVAARTHPAFMAPVGSLLAVAAWYQGARDVASRIIAAVLELSPSYSMAHLVDTALSVGVPADELGRRLPTPVELDRAMGAPRPEWLWPLQQSLTRYLNTEERPSA